jgi:hypothetical protein
MRLCRTTVHLGLSRQIVAQLRAATHLFTLQIRRPVSNNRSTALLRHFTQRNFANPPATNTQIIAQLRAQTTHSRCKSVAHRNLQIRRLAAITDPAKA